jgi:DNA replicative helicase MCM subunit Mcm2 (Cdc46/Mcm family)
LDYYCLVFQKELIVMPTIQIETEQLLNAALQMPQEEFEQFLAKLLSIKARERAPVLSERESELLLKINEGLSPTDAKRMKDMIAKRQSYTITEAELQELIRLTDEAERLNVERLKHLIELAHLRNVTLDQLMDQLGLRPEPYD